VIFNTIIVVNTLYKVFCYSRASCLLLLKNTMQIFLLFYGFGGIRVDIDRHVLFVWNLVNSVGRIRRAVATHANHAHDTPSSSFNPLPRASSFWLKRSDGDAPRGCVTVDPVFSPRAHTRWPQVLEVIVPMVPAVIEDALGDCRLMEH